ncbi:MAG: UDP-N-acetylglucosamine 2-epimerase (non-hydrolyzing) [Planctomycetota bacterium]
MASARILLCLGTRPEAIKLAPLILALRGREGVDARVLVTGQHRDLAPRALAFFGLAPDRSEAVEGDGREVEALLAALEAAAGRAIDAEVAQGGAADLVVVQGDASSALAAARAAHARGIPVAHVEAGLRSGGLDAPFPEERNRRDIAGLAALHLAPTEGAAANLRAEGVPDDAIHVTGNTGIDALLYTRDRVDRYRWTPAPGRLLVLATVHRRESFGAPIRAVLAALATLAARPDLEVLLPVHPNPEVRGAVDEVLRGRSAVRLVDPLEPPELVAALMASTLVLSDSGGLQEEAPALGKPILVLRDNTERPEGVLAGSAILVGTDTKRIVATAASILDDAELLARMSEPRFPYGDGRSAPHIAALCAAFVAG